MTKYFQLPTNFNFITDFSTVESILEDNLIGVVVIDNSSIRVLLKQFPQINLLVGPHEGWFDFYAYDLDVKQAHMVLLTHKNKKLL